MSVRPRTSVESRPVSRGRQAENSQAVAADSENRRQPRFDLGWILVILLTVFAIAPLTYPGFFQVHSGFLPAFNVEHASDALSSAPSWGRIADPVRGEGKLPYLLVWPFFNWSRSGVVAIKWGYGLAFALGALGIYAWTRHWLGARGGVLASVVYTYLPWHLSTVYVRGAYAEAWLWALWPFLFWAVDRWIEGRLLAAGIVGLLALIAVLWTQPGLFALSVLLLAAYSVATGVAERAGRRRFWSNACLAGALTLALLLLWYAAGKQPEARLAFAKHFLSPYQLLSAAWPNGLAGSDYLSFQLGLAGVGLSIVGVALWLSRRSERALDADEIPSVRPVPLGRALGFWVIVLLVLVFLTLPLSALPWRVSGFDALLTYPWQLLALAGLPLAFLAGSVVRMDERLATLPAWAGMIAFVVLASYPYLAPRFTQVDPGLEPVATFQPVGADVPQLMLLDYQIAPPNGMGAPTEITRTLTLTLTWQTVEPLAGDYTVFVHVLAEGDTKAAQRDTRPCDGDCPTNNWRPGEIITDRHQLNLSPDAPPGPYRLAVGLYVLDTGERAAVLGRDDRTVFLDVR